MDNGIGSGRSPSRRLSSFDSRVPPDPAMLYNCCRLQLQTMQHVGQHLPFFLCSSHPLTPGCGVSSQPLVPGLANRQPLNWTLANFPQFSYAQIVQTCSILAVPHSIRLRRLHCSCGRSQDMASQDGCLSVRTASLQQMSCWFSAQLKHKCFNPMPVYGGPWTLHVSLPLAGLSNAVYDWQS